MKMTLIVCAILAATSVAAWTATPPVAPNGIPLYQDYRSWEAVAPSYREDKQHIRIILGNPVAIKAMKEKIRPFPDGTVLAKIAWTTRKHPKFPVATEPASFVQVEFMVKDAVRYKATGGWGFARFVGSDYKPYGGDAGFVQECFACHQPVKDNDFVFTSYGSVP